MERTQAAQRTIRLLAISMSLGLTPLGIGRVAYADTGAKVVNAAPDNAQTNKLYKDAKGATAEDQSNAKADVEIIRKIRRSIVDNDNLSTYAHNVKILAEQGQVTLRGPVRSQQEKASIEAVARNVAGPTNVHSELAVVAH